jgi:uncharacterized protein
MDIGEILRRRTALPHRQERHMGGHRTQPAPLDRLAPGRWVESDLGRCFVAEHAYSLAHRHGDLALGDLVTTADSPLLGRFFRQGPFDLTQAAWIDTETTGLGRGAGTYCFLVGVGQIEGEHLVVRQYFMPDYGDEPCLLDLVLDSIDRSAGLVSFNGIGFDVPLLDARCVLNGYGYAPLGRRPHLDLLPVARRLWRRMLDSCALVALERDLLEVPRPADDVPGYLIPSVYQDYIRSGETAGIAKVMLHNTFDILSMVTLATRAAHVLAEDARARPGPHRDPVSIGQLYENEGQPDEALAAYRQGLQSGRGATREECGQRIAMMLKRMGRWQEAADLWREALEGTRLHPYVELAKYLEHQKRDYQEARCVVLRALTSVRQGRLRGPSPSTALGELEYRLARLERRIQGQTRSAEHASSDEPKEIGE